MPHSSPRSKFQIHEDSECRNDALHGTMPPKRQTSDQTVIHRLADAVDDSKKARVEDEETKDELQDAFDQLQQAIDDPQDEPVHSEHVVRDESISGDDSESKIDDNSASDYEHGNDSLLSEDTNSHHEPVSGLTDPIINDYSHLDESNDESTYEDENSNSIDENESIGNSKGRSHDKHTEALIQSAARVIVASIEQGRYHQENSVLSAQTDDSYDGRDGTEMTYDDGTELTYGTESTLENEIEEEDKETEVLYQERVAPGSGVRQSERGTSDSGSGGSPDNDDDVFSHDDERSPRSSINSCGDLHVDEIDLPTKEQSKATQDETDADSEDHEDFDPEDMEPPRQPISRIPSNYSTLAPHHSLSSPVQDNDSQHSNKVISHPPFRSPSSVRAIQMASPTPSNLGSSRSSIQFRPTVSRLGTPSSQSPKKPTRQLKFKKEYPLVLLHVTVLPLRWLYENVIEIGDALPEELRIVRDNWRLLQDHTGNTVLERGILLPHPQDSYETLEERLLDALELPAGPHARILKCGHYMGTTSDSESSDEENADTLDTIKSCNVCGRVVRYEEILGSERADQRFRIKVYASNGLMRAGAWAAAWKEMERIDVEIEPFVPRQLIDMLEDLLMQQDNGELPISPSRMGSRAQIRSPAPEHETVQEIEEEVRKRQDDEQRLREIYGHEADEKIAISRPQSRANVPSRPISRATGTPISRHNQRLSNTRSQDFDRERVFSSHPDSARFHELDQRSQPSTPRPVEYHEGNLFREERPVKSRPQSRVSRPLSRTGKHDNASLPQLLFAAIKVFLKDRRNLAILLLSAFVLVLAIRPGFGEKVLEADGEGVMENVEMVVDAPQNEALGEVAVETVTTENSSENATVVDVKEVASPSGIDYAEIRKIIEEGLRPVIEASKKGAGSFEGDSIPEQEVMKNIVVEDMIIGVEKTVTEPVNEDFIRKVVEEQLRLVLGGMDTGTGNGPNGEFRELGGGEAVAEDMEVEVMV